MNNTRIFRKLSEVRSAKSIPMFSTVMTPGSHCPMHSAVSFGSFVQGLSMLVVGSAECTVYSRGPSTRRRGNFAPGEKVISWSYLISENETVFGCRDGIEKSIEEMLGEGIEALMVVTTCVPQLMGEDINGLCKEIAERRDAKVFCVDVPHYTYIGTSVGTKGALSGLFELMEDRMVDSKRINVIGSGRDSGMFFEMAELLESKGYILLQLGSEEGVKDYVTASSAQLNLVSSPQALDLAIKMKERFGTEYVDMSATFSYDEIMEGFSVIEKTLRIEIPDFSDRKEKIEVLEKKVSEKMSGKRFALGAGVSQVPLRIANYLVGLGMVPAVMHIDDIYTGEEQIREDMLSQGFDPIVAHMANNDIDSKYINQIGVDIIIASSRRARGGAGGENGLGFERTMKLLNTCLNGERKEGYHGATSI